MICSSCATGNLSLLLLYCYPWAVRPMHPAGHAVLTWQKESQGERGQGALTGTAVLLCHNKMELSKDTS